MGLKPILRRVWSRRGERPLAPVHHRYEWLYVYGFVRPATGRTFWLILPTVNKELFSVALREFARWIRVGKDKRVVLAVDQAGWHTSKDVALPEGLHLLKLPTHSPELQPAERLWPLVDENPWPTGAWRTSTSWRACWLRGAKRSSGGPRPLVRAPASTGGGKRHVSGSYPKDSV